MHGVFNGYSTCGQSIVLQILNTWGLGPVDESCLQTLLPPDFDGSDSTTQSLSVTAFGVADLWNAGGLRDSVAESCPICASCAPCSSSTPSSDKVETIEYVILGLVSIILILALLVFTVSYLRNTNRPLSSLEERKVSSL